MQAGPQGSISHNEILNKRVAFAFKFSEFLLDVKTATSLCSKNISTLKQNDFLVILNFETLYFIKSCPTFIQLSLIVFTKYNDIL